MYSWAFPASLFPSLHLTLIIFPHRDKICRADWVAYYRRRPLRKSRRMYSFCKFCLIFRAPKNCVSFWERVNSTGKLDGRNVHSSDCSRSNPRCLNRSTSSTRSTGSPCRANSTSRSRCYLRSGANCRSGSLLRGGK